MAVKQPSRRPKPWSAVVVALLTAMWALSLAYFIVELVLVAFALGMHGWADHHGGDYSQYEYDQLNRRLNDLTWWIGVLLPAGPGLAGIVAIVDRRVWTAGIFALLAVLLAIPGAVLLVGRTRVGDSRAAVVRVELAGQPRPCPRAAGTVAHVLGRQWNPPSIPHDVSAAAATPTTG